MMEEEPEESIVLCSIEETTPEMSHPSLDVKASCIQVTEKAQEDDSFALCGLPTGKEQGKTTEGGEGSTLLVKESNAKVSSGMESTPSSEARSSNDEDSPPKSSMKNGAQGHQEESHGKATDDSKASSHGNQLENGGQSKVVEPSSINEHPSNNGTGEKGNQEFGSTRSLKEVEESCANVLNDKNQASPCPSKNSSDLSASEPLSHDKGDIATDDTKSSSQDPSSNDPQANQTQKTTTASEPLRHDKGSIANDDAKTPSQGPSKESKNDEKNASFAGTVNTPMETATQEPSPSHDSQPTDVRKAASEPQSHDKDREPTSQEPSTVKDTPSNEGPNNKDHQGDIIMETVSQELCNELPSSESLQELNAGERSQDTLQSASNGENEELGLQKESQMTTSKENGLEEGAQAPGDASVRKDVPQEDEIIDETSSEEEDGNVDQPPHAGIPSISEEQRNNEELNTFWNSINSEPSPETVLMEEVEDEFLKDLEEESAMPPVEGSPTKIVEDEDISKIAAFINETSLPPKAQKKDDNQKGLKDKKRIRIQLGKKRVGRPPNSSGKPRNPVGRPPNSSAKPPNPVGRPPNSSAKPPNPVSRPPNISGKPRNPVGRPRKNPPPNPVGRPPKSLIRPVGRPPKPVGRPSNRFTKHRGKHLRVGRPSSSLSIHKRGRPSSSSSSKAAISKKDVNTNANPDNKVPEEAPRPVAQPPSTPPPSTPAPSTPPLSTPPQCTYESDWRKIMRMTDNNKGDTFLEEILYKSHFPGTATFRPSLPGGFRDDSLERLQCPACPDSFLIPTSFFQHLYRKSCEINFKCKLCNNDDLLSFPNRCALKVHFLSHMELDKELSSIDVEHASLRPPPKAEGAPTYILDPMRGELFNKDKTQCPECRLCVDSLGSHLHKVHKVIHCPSCPLILPNPCSYGSHARIHAGAGPFICPECGEGFQSLGVFRDHVLNFCLHAQRTLRFSCPFRHKDMDASRLEYGEILQHFSEHHLRLLYKCSYCSRAYTKESAILSHLKEEHSGLPEYLTEKENFTLLYKTLIAKEKRIFCKRESFEAAVTLAAEAKWRRRYYFSCPACKELFKDSEGLHEHGIQWCRLQHPSSNGPPPLFPPLEKSKYPPVTQGDDNFCNEKNCLKCTQIFDLIQNHKQECLPENKKEEEVTPKGGNDETQQQSRRDTRSTTSTPDEPTSRSKDVEEDPESDHEREDISSRPRKRGRKPKERLLVETLGLTSPSNKSILHFNRLPSKAMSKGSTVLPKRMRTSLHNCSLCDYKSNDRMSFLAHIKAHSDSYGASPLQCKECGMSFASEPSLRKHLFLIHRIRVTSKEEEELSGGEYICGVCSRAFESLKDLKKHVRGHGPMALKRLSAH